MPRFVLKNVLETLQKRDPKFHRNSSIMRYIVDMGLVGSSSVAVEKRARKEIIAGLKRLKEDCFSETVPIRDYQGKTLTCDVYALKAYKNWDWYVKIHMTKDDQGHLLFDVSFHLPDETMKDPKGLVLCYSGKVQAKQKANKEEW